MLPSIYASNMAKLLYVVAILLSLSMVFAGDAANDDNNETADVQPSSTEGKAGEAIKTLLQEKITQKFKEAANEVKGVLVKQLGDSLKSAHDVFKSRDKNKVNAANAAKAQGKAGAAAIHQNKANRHRKNSGPAGGIPATEAKGGAPIPLEGKGPGPIEGKGPGPIEGKGVPFSEAKGPGPIPPPPPLNCAPQPPCGPPPMDMTCCDQQQMGGGYLMQGVNMPPPPMSPMGCAPGPCQQTCGPSCAPQQCCPGKREKITAHKGKKLSKKDD